MIVARRHLTYENRSPFFLFKKHEKTSAVLKSLLTFFSLFLNLLFFS